LIWEPVTNVDLVHVARDTIKIHFVLRLGSPGERERDLPRECEDRRELIRVQYLLLEIGRDLKLYSS
jgi:hypothetical protein